MIRGFILLIQFFTRIPVPVTIEYDDELYSKNIFLVPIVGFIIGLPLFGVYYFLNGIYSPFLAATIIVTIEIFLTGALHIDGLADSADGFYSYRSSEVMMEIMKDSRIGTNGTLAVVMVLVLKIALLSSLSSINGGIFVLLMPVFSRLTIPWIAGVSKYARKERGMGAALVKNTGLKQIIISTLVTVAITLPFLYEMRLPLLTFIFITVIALFSLLLSKYSSFKIGGITGDVVGASIELSEIFYLAAVLVAEKIPMEYLCI